MPTYIALLCKDEDSDFGVFFPDLPGCVSAGSTEAEAMLMAQEALSLHLRGLQDSGCLVPRPRDYGTIAAAGEMENALRSFEVTVPHAQK